MFLPGQKVKNRKGDDLEIVIHFQSGRYPVLAKNKKGITSQYTHDGRFVQNQESPEDLIDEGSTA